MKIRVLTSGSKGNCSYVESRQSKLLIDDGIRYHRLVKELEKLTVTLDEIDALLLTHTHTDHILGLNVLIKHSHFPIFITEQMYPDLKEFVPKERLVIYQEEMHLDDISLTLIKTSHDAPGSVGFIFEEEEHSLVYITDTGYINRKYLAKIKDKEIYYLESNHDEQMLMDGPYPYMLKQRILSDNGHLSNEMASKYLQKVIGPSTRWIILAHLSEHNNKVELALSTLATHLEETDYQPRVVVASQTEVTEVIEV